MPMGYVESSTRYLASIDRMASDWICDLLHIRCEALKTKTAEISFLEGPARALFFGRLSNFFTAHILITPTTRNSKSLSTMPHRH